MKKAMRTLVFPFLILFFHLPILATVRYVDLNSPNPTPPYTNWPTAATNIQDAVDAAVDGDEIVVTNGVYATGGRVVYGAMTNRVAVTKPLLVRSVNGPAVTAIKGYRVPDTILGDAAVRCVYLGNNATLSGFTLTEGATRNAGDSILEKSGAGIWCELGNSVVSNCVIVENSAGESGGGAYGGIIVSCTIITNSAYRGGGASGGSLSNCTFAGNSATSGGGANGCTLNDCSLLGNFAGSRGGAAYGGALTNCYLANNSTRDDGGGVHASILYNCVLAANASVESGGGANQSTLFNCMLTNNVSGNGGGAGYSVLNNCALSDNTAGRGGGAYSSFMTNCTLTGNSANEGGGSYSSVTCNSIVYYNTSLVSEYANYRAGSFDYSCTTPLPAGGVANLEAEPQLATVFRLSLNSPCRYAGSAISTSGMDIDGEPWVNPPSIGCDEYHTGSVTGALAVAISAAYTNVVTGFREDFRAQTSGRVGASRWEFGDGTIVSNRPYASHAWLGQGDFEVVLRAYNETYPGGITATVMVHVLEQPIHFVALDSANPVAPYTAWETAATNIQDAVDAAYTGGTVLVSNGVYQAGGRLASGSVTNRVVVNRPLILRSFNGPAVTMIRGYQVPGTSNGTGAVRGVYLAGAAVFAGFTVSHGATLASGDINTDQSGGGVWCESTAAVITNCTFDGNSAAYYGAGAYQGTLINCAFRNNSADYGGGASAQGNLSDCTLSTNSAHLGGGAYGSVMNQCLIIGNSAQSGAGAFGCLLNHCTVTGNSGTSRSGGANQCTLENCIVYYNLAPSYPNYYGGIWNYSCTTPDPGGLGNITNEPLFLNLAGGNLRPQTTSPCINAGNNGYATNSTDLDGNPRIAGGTVDIGAYEYQSPSSVLSYAWLLQYSLPTDGSADFTDPDGEGMNNWQEWRADTIPTNALSVLRMLSPTGDPSGVTVSWESVPTRTYCLDRATDPAAQPAFSTIATNLAGHTGSTTYTDTSATNGGPYFYRVVVQP